ncbi:hypothetical protein HDU78_003612, partial [Chytriomyces hyalinus]
MPQEAPAVKVTTRKEDIALFLSGSKPHHPVSQTSTSSDAYLEKEGLDVAVKFIDMNKIQLSTWLPDATSLTGGTVLPEISILQQLGHPNIIKYIDHVVEPTKYMLLITGLHRSNWQRTSTSSTMSVEDDDVEKCTLFDLFKCITLAVNHLQVPGLVCWDIKDETIVVDSNCNVNMIDFGSAARIIPKTQPQYFTQFCSTIPYASPEIVQKESYHGPKVEVWALGVLLYIMIFKNPFRNGKERAEGIVLMPRGLHLDSDRHYSGGCRNLMHRMLEFDPESRSTINE